MALLKIFGLLLLLTSCGLLGNTVTEVVTLNMESDTYIEENSEQVHGGEAYLRISNDGVRRNTLMQLPSADESGSEESFITAIVEAIFDGIFDDGCDRSKILNIAYLDSIELVLYGVSSSDAAQAAQLRLLPISRQWWQGATWTKAHPFTSEGFWDDEGGDVLDSVSSVPAVDIGAAYPRVEFDVLSLVSQGTNSYSWGSIPAMRGFRIEGDAGVDASFYSAQSPDYAPFLRFTYTGPCIP